MFCLILIGALLWRDIQRYTFGSIFGIAGDAGNNVIYIADFSAGNLLKIQYPQMDVSTVFGRTDTFPGIIKL